METKPLKIMSVIFIVAIAAVWVYSFLGTSIGTMVFQGQSLGESVDCQAPDCQCWSERINVYFPSTNSWENNVYVCGWTYF